MFIITGFVLFSLASRKEIVTEIVGKTERQWSVSAPLQKSDRMVVEIRQGINWSIGPFEPPDYEGGPYLLGVDIDVKNPLGNTTKFFLILASRPPNPILTIWSIEILRQGGGLNPTPFYDEKTKTYHQIGGIVEYDGMYNVTVVNIYPPRYDPPTYLGIRKEKTATENPSIHFLEGGIVMVVGGAIAMLIGLRSPKHRAPPKRKLERQKLKTSFGGNFLP